MSRHALRLICVHVTTALCTSSLAIELSAQAVTQTITSSSSVQFVATDTPVRSISQGALWGFHMQWNAVQGDPATASDNGVWNNATRQFNPEVLAFMQAHFGGGGIYRYPGGTTANDFNWKESLIQPAQNRPQQYVSSWGKSVVPYFGFGEFMDLVEQLGGQAGLTINLGLGAESAADWVEYCNAAIGTNPGGGVAWGEIRAANGHPAPYNVRYWELGNELDIAKPTGWTVGQYIAAATPVAAAMKAIDPTIEIAAHTASGANMANQQTWYDWHRAVLADATLAPLLDGIAIHLYCGGNNISAKGSDTIWAATAMNDASPKKVWVTEHSPILHHSVVGDPGHWPQLSNMNAAMLSADMLFTFAYHPGIAIAEWHALAGSGPWRLFNTVDPITNRHTGVFGVRPAAHALGLINRYLSGKSVLQTTVSSPNASSYQGGYDVRGIALKDGYGGGLSIAAMNRASVGYSTQATLPGLAAGNYVAMREYVGGADAGASGIIRHFFNLPVATSGSNGVFTFPLPHLSVTAIRPLGPNRLVNASLETDSNGDGVPDHWIKRESAGVTGTVSSLSDGTRFEGAKYIRLRKNAGSGVGALSVDQSRSGNNALNHNGHVGLHANDYHMVSVCARADGLDAVGARIHIRIYQRDDAGEISLAAGFDSPVLAGTSTDWVTLSVPAFRPDDFIQPGHTFNFMEVCLQNRSATGSVDFDAPGLLHLPNQLRNASLETDAHNTGTPDLWEVRKGPGVAGTAARYSGGAVDGAHYLKLAKTNGVAGAISLVQKVWLTDANTPHHANETFAASAFLRANGLDSSGARLRVQIFKKDPAGAVTIAGFVDSPVLGGTTGWTKVSLPTFRPADHIPSGHTLARIEFVVQNLSAAGSVDADDANFHAPL